MVDGTSGIGPSSRWSSLRQRYRTCDCLFCLLALAVGHCAKDGSIGAVGCRKLSAGLQTVPKKLALIGGLGMSLTFLMVVAKPLIGILMVQVMLVSGEVFFGSIVDLFAYGSARLLPKLPGLLMVMFGVGISFWSDLQDYHVKPVDLLLGVLCSWGASLGLVMHSVAGSHVREHLGAVNTGAWAAGVGSVGNITVCIIAVATGASEGFHIDQRPSTLGLAVVMGLCSAYMVFITVFVPQRIGFSMMFCLMTAGRMTGGVAVDTIKISKEHHGVSVWRLFGLCAVLAGVILARFMSYRAEAEFADDTHAGEKGSTVTCCGEEDDSTDSSDEDSS